MNDLSSVMIKLIINNDVFGKKMKNLIYFKDYYDSIKYKCINFNPIKDTKEEDEQKNNWFKTMD